MNASDFNLDLSFILLIILSVLGTVTTLKIPTVSEELPLFNLGFCFGNFTLKIYLECVVWFCSDSVFYIHIHISKSR